MLPSDPGKRRIAIALWVVLATVGTVAVWWLSSYLESLSALAQTDRAAALVLFRTRAMPALLAVVAVAVAAGALVLRQGLEIVRTGERGGKTIGAVLAGVGFVLAAVPLVLISVVFWLLRRV